MSSASSIRVRRALSSVAGGGELDDALCDWLTELLRGEDGVGVDVNFASESLSSFLSHFPTVTDSIAAHQIAAAAIAAACGKTPATLTSIDTSSSVTGGGSMSEALAEFNTLSISGGDKSSVGKVSVVAVVEEEKEEEDLSIPLSLREMFPTATQRALRLALTKSQGDVNVAIDVVLDAGGPEALDKEALTAAQERVNKARAETKFVRAAVLARFSETVENSDVIHRPRAPAPSSAPKKGERVLRYVDGVPVHLSAREKFIVEKPVDSAGTFVSLKIAKKGSGGPSPGFKK
jgi:hypothetical protein